MRKVGDIVRSVMTPDIDKTIVAIVNDKYVVTYLLNNRLKSKVYIERELLPPPPTVLSEHYFNYFSSKNFGFEHTSLEEASQASSDDRVVDRVCIKRFSDGNWSIEKVK